MSKNKSSSNHNLILSSKGLKKNYQSGPVQLEVLRGINLEIQKGEIVSVVGPSGAGKSTLLHLLGGLDRPTSGTVYWDNQDIFSLSDYELANLRNSMVGFLFQFHHLLSEFTALENVGIPRRMRGISARESHQKAQSLLESLGLGDRSHHRPGELSGGEQQRVALARALINDPPILLADEPTGNLDHHTGQQVLEVLWDLRVKREQTIIIVTHDPAVAERADRCIRVDEGQILAIR